jgi:hypothetical protein
MAIGKELKIESMRNQIIFMAVVRTRLLKWAAEIKDQETANTHIETAESFLHTLRQYRRLLDSYEHPPDVGTAA